MLWIYSLYTRGGSHIIGGFAKLFKKEHSDTFWRASVIAYDELAGAIIAVLVLGPTHV